MFKTHFFKVIYDSNQWHTCSKVVGIFIRLVVYVVRRTIPCRDPWPFLQGLQIKSEQAIR
jgi:hypothetical protein